MVKLGSVEMFVNDAALLKSIGYNYTGCKTSSQTGQTRKQREAICGIVVSLYSHKLL